jgi:hypothetical protein
MRLLGSEPSLSGTVQKRHLIGASFAQRPFQDVSGIGTKCGIQRLKTGNLYIWANTKRVLIDQVRQTVPKE